MAELIIKILYAIFPVFFGITLSCAFSGISFTRKNVITLCVFLCYAIGIRYFSVFHLDTVLAAGIYPLVIHLPLFLCLVLCCGCSWAEAAISIFTAFLSYQLPYWFCYFIMHFFKNDQWLNILIYSVVCPAFLLFMLHYVASSIRQILCSSVHTCLAFGWAPLTYHLFYHISLFRFQGFTERSNLIMGLLTFIIGVVYIIFAVEYNRKLQQLLRSEQERRLLAMQASQAAKNLKNFQESANQARIYRHDMRHHLSMITGYFEQGEFDKAKQYLNSVLSDIDSFTPQHFCENPMVDLLLSMFVSQAETEGITLKTRAVMPEELTISETDLCSLLSNALENAIHATQMVSDREKVIRFQCRIVGNNLLIQVENPVSEPPDMCGGIPITRAEGHGLGTKSIVNIVERYHGMYQFACKDRIFSLKVVLPR